MLLNLPIHFNTQKAAVSSTRWTPTLLWIQISEPFARFMQWRSLESGLLTLVGLVGTVFVCPHSMQLLEDVPGSMNILPVLYCIKMQGILTCLKVPYLRSTVPDILSSIPWLVCIACYKTKDLQSGVGL